jgi:hypothetical protein
MANKGQGDARKNKIVITEMKEFALGMQLQNEGNLLEVFSH